MGRGGMGAGVGNRGMVGIVGHGGKGKEEEVMEVAMDHRKYIILTLLTLILSYYIIYIIRYLSHVSFIIKFYLFIIIKRKHYSHSTIFLENACRSSNDFPLHAISNALEIAKHHQIYHRFNIYRNTIRAMYSNSQCT